MFTAVSPLSIQCCRWCAVQTPGGRSQPGKTHPPSRATKARRMPIGTVRIARPTSRGSDSPMTTGITLQPSGTLAGRCDLIECSAGDGEGKPTEVTLKLANKGNRHSGPAWCGEFSSGLTNSSAAPATRSGRGRTAAAAQAGSVPGVEDPIRVGRQVCHPPTGARHPHPSSVSRLRPRRPRPAGRTGHAERRC